MMPVKVTVTGQTPRKLGGSACTSGTETCGAAGPDGVTALAVGGEGLLDPGRELALEVGGGLFLEVVVRPPEVGGEPPPALVVGVFPLAGGD